MALKMYILLKEFMDPGHMALSAAHASLGGYLSLKDQNPLMEEWVKTSFRKVVCKVSDEEFEKAKTYGESGKDYRVMTESAFDNAEVSLVFCPREEWPPFFKSLKLYR